MKTGRRGVEPTKKGEDPKKPKAQGEVKVTAKKQYTWDDVSKDLEARERNKAAREQYQSDLENYNKAMKLYREGPGPQNNVGQKLATAKLKGGEIASFEQGQYDTAEKTNKLIQEKLKRGELVPVDDPSLDPTTRKILRGVMLGSKEGEADIVGTTGRRYVEKGTKYSSYKDVYGEDFNPEEWRAAAKAGKMEQYMASKGYSSDRAFVPKGGYYQEYKTPVKPQEPYYEKEQNIDARKLPIDKLPINQAKLAKGKLATGKATSAPIEKQDWEGPAGGTKYRTKYSLPQTTSRDNKTLGGFAVNLARFVKEEARGIGKPKVLTHGLNKTQGKARLIQGKTGREEQMAKAYFGGGFGNQPMSTIRERQDVLKAGKAETKAGIKEARKEGNREKVAAYRAVKKDYNAEMKQAKLAGKYLKAYDREAQGVNVNTDVNKYGGKIKTFTGQAMAGFEGSKQDVFNKYASSEKYIRKSTDNPANKNTISNQEKSLSFKEKVQQDREARKSAPSFSERRKEKKASQALQKSIKIPGQ